ncbi:MAG: energy transducer TonB [Alteraurantiacibacter sp.]
METATQRLSKEELVGLLLAGTAHVALAMVLILHQPEPKPYTPPERITVSLAEDVALDSSAPDPSPEPAAAMAPELAPLPQPPAAAPPPPPPRPTARPSPRPTPTATRRPSPAPTASRRPSPAPTASRSARPSPAPSPAASARASPAPTATSGGASRIGENFLDGASDSTGDRGQAAARPSAAQQASIGAAIIRELKPHWNPPSGVDVDQLVTVVRFRLNRDGSLDGTPEIVRQTGINDANRLQAARHQEQAIRAVRLAAPFDLPEQLYAGWRVITSNFDNRLAQ